jgi:hypothetical protein
MNGLPFGSHADHGAGPVGQLDGRSRQDGGLDILAGQIDGRFQGIGRDLNLILLFQPLLVIAQHGDGLFPCCRWHIQPVGSLADESFPV